MILIVSRWGRCLCGILIGMACAPALTGCAMNTDPAMRGPDAELQWPVPVSTGSVAFTPDGDYLVATAITKDAREGIITCWDVKTRRVVKSLRLPSMIWSIDFSDDGKTAIAAVDDKSLRVYSLPEWKESRVIDRSPYLTSRVAYIGSAKFIVGTDSARSASVWTWNIGEGNPTKLTSRNDQTTGVAVSLDRKRFGILHLPTVFEVWDADMLKTKGHVQLRDEEGSCVSAAFSPDNKIIAVGTSKPLISIWDGETYKPKGTLVGLIDIPQAMGFTPDGKYLIASLGLEADGPFRVCIWDVASRKLVHSFIPWERGCSQQAISGDNRWLAINGIDGAIGLWDLTKLRREFEK